MSAKRGAAGALERLFRTRARHTLRLLGVRDATLSIFLLPSSEMEDLEGRFLGRRKGAHALAFPEPRTFPHPECKGRFLGEVYLDRDLARRAPQHAVALLIHGILHLLGYRHERKRDMMQMEAVARGLKKRLQMKKS